MVPQLEARLESYKQHIAQLEESLLAEQRNTDKSEFEAKKAREERDRLALEKQVCGRSCSLFFV